MPIDIVILKQIISYLKKGCFDRYTDRLMISSCTKAFFGFLTCGEFSSYTESSDQHALCVHDIVIDTQKMLVHLRQSKTDPFRRGISINIFATNNEVCPVAAMQQYLAVRPHSVSQSLFLLENGSPMTRKVFIDNLKFVLRCLGIDDSKFNGHSLRIGAATTCSKLRIEDHLIKHWVAGLRTVITLTFTQTYQLSEMYRFPCQVNKRD